MKIWILVFMWQGQPMASGPHELETCLSMAQTQIERTGYTAHCYRISGGWKREYPKEVK